MSKTLPEQILDLTAQLAAANANVTGLTAQNSTLATEKANLATELAEAQKRENDAKAALDSEKANSAQLAEALNKAKESITALTAERDNLAAKEQDLEKRANALAVQKMAAVGQPEPVATQGTPKKNDEQKDEPKGINRVIAAIGRSFAAKSSN